MRSVFSVVGGILLVVMFLAFVLGFRTFAFQPFSIPSGSMAPTLLVGDYVVVSKFSYGYTHYSLPFSAPVISGRIDASDPQPGDVVVFKLPKDDRTDYVKRVIGLPGDRVQMINGELNINGQTVKRERLEDFIDADNGRATQYQHWRETLPNGASYETLQLMDNGFLSNTAVFDVPQGDFFALGDNRDNSVDSRMPDVGFVPFDHLVGQVRIIFYSAHPERVGTLVR
jgi:signal peptidase I